MSPRVMNHSLTNVLFFDLCGYSELENIHIKEVHEKIWPDLWKKVIKPELKGHKYVDTWGDGILIVCDDETAIIKVGLSLNEYFKYATYLSLKVDLNSKPLLGRIAIHRQVVYKIYDPFQGRDNYYGKGIIRAARIEPVTPPGTVWVSETIRNHIKTIYQDKEEPFDFIPRGNRALAKEFGILKIYEAFRKGGKGRSKRTLAAELSEIKSVVIRNLTKINPTKTDLHFCCDADRPKEKLCSLPSDALSIISDMRRSSIINYDTSNIIKILNGLLIALEKANSDRKAKFDYEELDEIKKRLDEYYIYFEGSGRKSYSSSVNETNRRREFISHRCRDIIAADILINFDFYVNNMKREINIIDDKRDGEILGDKINRIVDQISTSKSFNEALKGLPRILINIIKTLEDVHRNGILGVSENLDNSLRKSERLSIRKNIANAFTGMPHRSNGGGKLPWNWREERRGNGKKVVEV
jgi:hypothetical protein